MFEHTLSDAFTQLYSMPLGFILWIRWLGLVNVVGGLVFVRRPQARWVLAAMVFILVTNVGLMMAGSGLVKLLSIPHLFAWIPLVAYLAMQLRSGHVDIRKPFGIWCLVVMVTDLVSVVFDLRDGAQYLLGDHGVVMPDALAAFPLVTLLVIATSTVALVAYALGMPRRDATT
jgi:hypothetical protein